MLLGTSLTLLLSPHLKLRFNVFEGGAGWAVGPLFTRELHCSECLYPGATQMLLRTSLYQDIKRSYDA